MKFDILSRWDKSTIFTAEIEADEGTSYSIKLGLAVKVAVKARAYLADADLARADLADANLAGANLARANLAGAYLDSADLAGAYLDGATLDGANLDGANLAGGRPIFQIGPIGSRSAYLVAYMTDKGVILKAGCFTGSVKEFEAKLEAEHGDNEHAQEYRAALELIAVHAELWTAVATEAA